MRPRCDGLTLPEALYRAIVNGKAVAVHVGSPDGPLLVWVHASSPLSKSRGLWFGVRTDQPEKGLIMSRRTLISLAASVIVGTVLIATVSTDAFARRGGGGGRAGAGIHHGGVHHGAVHRGGVYRGAAVRRGMAVGVGAAAVGAAAAGAYGAYGAQGCGYYPYPPCY